MTTKFSYDKLRMKRTDRLNEINKSTKDMIINSSKFTNYLNDYISAVQIPSFKTPEISCYPLLKNFFLIPLNKMHHYSQEEEQKQRGFRPMSSLKIQKNPKMSLPLPSLSTSLISITQKMKPMIKSSKGNSSQKKIMRIKSAMCVSMNNKDRSLNRDNSSFNRGCIINAFLPDWCFDDLVYDESVIFNKEAFYKQFINDKMNFIKDNNIENMTSIISSKFNEDTHREMTLILTSMKIEFKNKTNEKKKSTIIYLPFAYMFLFYYQGIEYFQHILLGIIKINEDTEQIILDEQCLYDVLRYNPSLLNINTNPDCTTEENFKDNKDRDKDNKVIRQKHHNRKETAEHLSLNSMPKKEPRHFNTLSQNAYNNYSFTWSTPKIIYQINISLPEVSIVFKKTQNNVSRYIDKELILFLLEKNFMHWDFYLINFLFSLKDFRLFIERMLSKKNSTHITGTTVVASTTTINKRKSSNSLSFKKITNLVELSPLKVHDFSLQDYTFSYFYSKDNEKNALHVLHSYSVSVFFSKLKPIKKFTFDFTFKQMFILNQILIQTGNLEAFIMKILITDSSIGVIQLNYAFFDHFDEDIFKDEEKSDIIGDNKNWGNGSHNKTNIKGIEILIDKPYLVKIFSDTPYRSNDILTMPISNDMICDLEGRKLSQWPKVLMNQSNYATRRSSECVRKNSKATQGQVNQSQTPIQKSPFHVQEASQKKRNPQFFQKKVTLSTPLES